MDHKDEQELNGNFFLLEMLPEEILLTIFTYLSAVDAIRIESVSKQWQARKIKWCMQLISFSIDVPAKQPWYFLFKVQHSNGYANGCAYDYDMKVWHACDFPWFRSSFSCDNPSSTNFYAGGCSFSSSNGLVCIINGYYHSRIFICNPMIKCGRMLPQIPGITIGCQYNFSNSIALSVDIKYKTYMVAMVGYKIPIRSSASDEEEASDEVEINIYLYESKKSHWMKLHSEKFSGDVVFGSYKCVICNGVIYYGISFRGVGRTQGLAPNAVLSYELSDESNPKRSILNMAIKMPYVFEFVDLMNLRDKLVIVGGIEKSRGDVEIGIWELYNKEWKEVTRMPPTIMKANFKDIRRTVLSVGCGDSIYIRPFFTSKFLVIFDFNHKTWKEVDAPKYLEPKQSIYDTFTGFCFEPRLDIRP